MLLIVQLDSHFENNSTFLRGSSATFKCWFDFDVIGLPGKSDVEIKYYSLGSRAFVLLSRNDL